MNDKVVNVLYEVTSLFGMSFIWFMYNFQWVMFSFLLQWLVQLIGVWKLWIFVI